MSKKERKQLVKEAVRHATQARRNHTMDQSSPVNHDLTIPISEGRVIHIPYPMTNEDLEVLVKTLALWKPQLIYEEERSAEETVSL